MADIHHRSSLVAFEQTFAGEGRSLSLSVILCACSARSTESGSLYALLLRYRRIHRISGLHVLQHEAGRWQTAPFTQNPARLGDSPECPGDSRAVESTMTSPTFYNRRTDTASTFSGCAGFKTAPAYYRTALFRLFSAERFFLFTFSPVQYS